jgi:hypothetical protein
MARRPEAQRFAMTTRPDSSGETPVTVLLDALAMILPPRGALLLSGPVASGRRHFEALARGAPDPERVRDENARALDAFAARLRGASAQPIINPAHFHVPHWRGRDYGVFFRGVIERFAASVWFIDGWQFSRGSIEENLFCAERGVVCFDESGHPLEAGPSRQLIGSAVAEVRRLGLDPQILLDAFSPPPRQSPGSSR